ncbi:2Fe-2S iron-sulfur cluster-binding protein [Pararhodobacter oceanensis]|uniref:Ferredoxin n=1 Tax=Pararhodobacter oceanensis TaxID=2172121 RepID=A0A2T8HPN7_9RHOB|nr:2Fe-2S iron-sulfur cluster-binding protein [Pararhodobacter oceanensis]PVH27407.1 ferredoxin [Pararhodobacter oceanensis]
MPKATYILPDGSKNTLAVPNGQSLMEAAIHNGLTAILGECGGSLACATCHCFVEDAPGPLPEISDHEDAMLDMTATDRTEQSRLSCQIIMSDALDGIVLRVPDEM